MGREKLGCRDICWVCCCKRRKREKECLEWYSNCNIVEDEKELQSESNSELAV